MDLADHDRQMEAVIASPRAPLRGVGLGCALVMSGLLGCAAVESAGPEDLARDASSSEPDRSCAGRTLVAGKAPLDLLIMLDKSGSMLLPTAGGDIKWVAVNQGLTEFINDSSTAGLGVGLQLFPLNVPGTPSSCVGNEDCGAQGPCVLKVCQSNGTPCASAADCSGAACIPFGWCANNQAFGCYPVGGSACTQAGGPGGACVTRSSSYCRNAESCDVSQYADPAVAIGELPGSAAALLNALAANRPAGISSTPTWPALQGALSHARARTRSHPERSVVVVFATDGLPSGRCQPKEIGAIAQAAGNALMETPALRTFVIGVFAGSDAAAQMNLDQIAAAGGTGKALITDTGQDVARQFIAALQAVRTSSIGCDLEIPQPMSGEVIDYAAINVEVQVPPAPRRVIPYVRERSKCHPLDGGWYYDVDPKQGRPAMIRTCPATCDGLGRLTDGSVDIRVGCATIIG